MARPRRPLGAGWVPGPGVGPRSLRPRLGKGCHAPPTHRCGGHRDGAHRPAPLQALITMSRRFGEEGRELSYGTYLKVPELLALQQRLSKEHDELLFIVAHQAYELWFKVILFELEAVRDFIDADDVFTARHLLHRVCVIEKLLVEQIEVLETMSPQDFLAFRSKIAPASGFQSVQFREIEFLSGLKEPKYVARLEASDDEKARLQRRLDQPSVDDAFRALVERRGSPSLLEIFRDRQRYGDLRSGERRVGEEGRSRWSPCPLKKKKMEPDSCSRTNATCLSSAREGIRGPRRRWV